MNLEATFHVQDVGDGTGGNREPEGGAADNSTAVGPPSLCIASTLGCLNSGSVCVTHSALVICDDGVNPLTNVVPCHPSMYFALYYIYIYFYDFA